MKFGQISNELQGWLKPLSPSQASNILNQARREIYSKRNWSFLYKETYLVFPNIIKVGTVEVTQYSNEVNINLDLKTILDANEAIIARPRIVGRQFRVTSSDNVANNIIYTILEYDSDNSKLILDNIYLGTSNSDARYEIFQSLFYPPLYNDNGTLVYDFKNFHYIANLREQRRLYLDGYYEDSILWDEGRTWGGTPFTVGAYNIDSNNQQIFELYPYNRTSNDIIYKVGYYREGRDLEDEEEVPNIIGESLLLSVGKIKAYEWAMANSKRFPELEVAGRFQNLIMLLNNSDYEQSYPTLLQEAKYRDEERFSKTYLGNYLDWDFYNIPNYLLNPEQPPRETLVLNF